MPQGSDPGPTPVGLPRPSAESGWSNHVVPFLLRRLPDGWMRSTSVAGNSVA